MNRLAMLKLIPKPFHARTLPLLLLATTLSACGPSAPAGPPPLEGAAIGGPFELVNGAGETVRWRDFDGKWRMVYFGYTWCPDVCPFDLNRMMLGYRQWSQDNPDLAADVVPLFITIDPERDTPAVIAEYTGKFGPQLIGLTGTQDAIKQAADAFGAYYERGPDDANVGYKMQHTNAAYLMDRQGQPIALLPVDESADGVAAQLAQWVR
ncbi:MAG: SCO family protein [Alteraurantiacibacter sp.]